MKKGFSFFLLILAFAAGARTVSLPRRGDNTVYIRDAATIMQAGDTVLLEGDYTWIKLFKIAGTKDSPVVFINKGLVTIGGYAPYTCVFSGDYFKISGNGDTAHKYGIRLGKSRDSVYGAFGFAFHDSKGVEVAHCEFQYLSCGILQNPAEGQAMPDCYYHDNYFHDLDNPKAKGRSEAFYLGNTKASTTAFEACRIESNLIENVSGDGIQASGGTFVIRGNTIRNYATAKLAQQRAGILIGGQATADIIDNIIEGGSGVGLQIFGQGNMKIWGNTFKNIDVQTLVNEDIIYINGKTATPETPLQIDFQNNEFAAVFPNRSVIHNATAADKTAGTLFKKNKGVEKSQTTLSKKDVWED